MKRDLSVITDEVRGYIQRWLRNERFRRCPFPSTIQCTKICPAVFPALRQIDLISGKVICPCDALNIPYVIKIAKKIIKV